MKIPTIFDIEYLKRCLNQIDVDQYELKSKSANKIEAYLANSRKEIDKKVEAHGGQSKAQRSEMLKQTKVDAKTLKDNASKKAPVEKEQVETKQASKDEGHEIGD